ncbi:hypothetical protein Zmor_006908 [Zophobas morio]|uniref:CCHC-type domain-containing protein n=1 Tax=Zophobas morio TaxID=2755281 RepID=A0AA38IW75_9CUCU|nr:hypothetical protein Zmor_006908 [Zophobas morio]
MSADALIRALEVGAAFRTTRTCYKVSVAEPEKEEEHNEIEKLLEKLLQQIDGLFRRWNNNMSHKQNVECYRCGRQGYLKCDCILDYQFQEEEYNRNLTGM